MIRRFLAWLVPLAVLSLTYDSAVSSTALVNNNGGAGQAEDSLCISFFVTDTVGNFSAADSFYVIVFNPWGDSVYGAAYIASAAEIKTVTVGGRKMYRWLEDVADIDGATPRSGTYSGVIVAVDTLDGSSSARLDQAFTFSFILEPTLAERAKIGDTLPDNGITAAKIASNAITASAIAADALGASEMDVSAWNENWTSASRTLTTDSFVVDMSSFNNSLDNDTSLVNFLRAARSSGGTGDSTSIARWVWNSPHGNHVVAGTFGKYLDAQVSGLGAGSGNFGCTLVAYDSAHHQVIPGVAMAIRNQQQSALLAVGATGPTGSCAVNLNAGTYTVIATAPGYLFSPAEQIAVSGAITDTVMAIRFDPGMPSSPSLCRVYGYVTASNRTPEADASVSAILPAGVVRSGNLVVSPMAISTRTDSLGYFCLDLIPSDLLTPNNSKYEFSITRPDGAILRQRVRIPNQSSWQLSW
jgi:hypothetical protein